MLRALLVADMGCAIDDAASRSLDAGNRGKLVALLEQALSVLGGDTPDDSAGALLPSRSPLAFANELRAFRGAPLLTGNVVFAIGVDAREPSDEGDAPSDIAPRLAASARRLRSYYQQGLIAWLRDARYAKAAAALPDHG